MTATARPRLLVLSSTYPRWAGDPEPGFVHELARRLLERFEVTVLCPHAPGAAREDLLDGVRVLRYRYAPSRLETLVNDGGIAGNLRRSPWKWLLLPGFLSAMAWSAWCCIHRWRPGVVHAHWLLPQGLAIAMLGAFDRRVPPFLVTAHGADVFMLRARPLQALKSFVTRRAAAITVVSTAMRDELARIGVDPARVSVESMGVDLAGRFTPDPGVARSPDELLFVGRLVEKKGLRHLIEALPAVIAAHPDAFLTVAGFGPGEAECRALAQRLGLQDKVRFIGAVPQAGLPALYRRAAVFVAPFVASKAGDQEGLGLVLVEAIGCGCPVVTTTLPAVRDVFAGRWPPGAVAPGSPEALAAAVGRVLAEPAAARVQAAVMLPELRARFDWGVVADRYAGALHALLAR